MWNWLKVLFRMFFGCLKPRRLPNGSPYRNAAEHALAVKEPAQPEPPKPTRQDVEAKAKVTGLTFVDTAFAMDALHVFETSREADEALQKARHLDDRNRSYEYLSILRRDLYRRELRALSDFDRALECLRTCYGHRDVDQELKSAIHLCTTLESAKRLRKIVARLNYDANRCDKNEVKVMLLSVDRLLIKLA